jgi:hypothetical protein
MKLLAPESQRLAFRGLAQCRDCALKVTICEFANAALALCLSQLQFAVQLLKPFLNAAFAAFVGEFGYGLHAGAIARNAVSALSRHARGPNLQLSKQRAQRWRVMGAVMSAAIKEPPAPRLPAVRSEIIAVVDPGHAQLCAIRVMWA